MNFRVGQLTGDLFSIYLGAQEFSMAGASVLAAPETGGLSLAATYALASHGVIVSGLAIGNVANDIRKLANHASKTNHGNLSGGGKGNYKN